MIVILNLNKILDQFILIHHIHYVVGANKYNYLDFGSSNLFPKRYEPIQQ